MQLNALCMLVVVLAIAVKAHIRIDELGVHLESNYKRAFIRSAVESIPLDNNTKLLVRNSAKPEFGNAFLPLRNAVESIPTPYQSNTSKLRKNSDIRSFVRDAVESLPNDEDGLEHMGFSTKYYNSASEDVEGVDPKSKKSTQHVNLNPWTISNKYAAFIAPGNSDDFYPMSYRAGSPHQELLNIMNIKPVKQPDKLDRYAERQSYGVLGYSNLPYQQSYGALGLVNRNDFKVTTKVLCYMSNWAFYRSGEAHFVPEQIDPNLCSVIIYSFASLDTDHLTIREFDSWVDLDNQYYRRVTSLGVPVLIALGGWTDSSGSKYSRLVSDNLRRRVFVSSVSSFLLRHGFSGLHLDWNYPKCWQSDCSRGPATDRPNLTKLLRELRTEFHSVNPKFQLGVAISGYKEIIMEAYDFPALSDIVDYMTVMTYDYHGAWEKKTGHVSPLYGLSSDTYPQYNTNYTMQLLLKMGAKREKLVLSIPFYGQSFTLAHAQQILAGPGVAATGPGEAGELTKQPGMLAYYEICERLTKFKWKSDRDLNLTFGPFAMLNDQWVGYDDATSVQAKARYAANNNFAGVAAWTVDLDDFRNLCCSESYPLLRAINRELGRLDSNPPTHPNCERPTLSVPPIPPQMTTISSEDSGGLVQNHDHTTSLPSWEDSSSLMFSTTKNPNPVSTTATSTVHWWSSSTERPREPTMTTARPTHTTIPVPAVIYPVAQASNCKSGEFYADSKNCNAYYHCIIAGELRQQFCPGGLHWNNEAKGCDWPSSAQCSLKLDQHLSTSYPKPTQTSKKPETTLKPNKKPLATSVHHPVSNTSSGPQYLRPTLLECNEGEYYPHRNCRKYYICVNKALVPSECGGDLHWDGIKKLCDWPENVQCVTSQKYLKIIQSSSANEEDPCNGEKRVPYPGNCSKYLFCLWNRLQANDCPPGLHYNEVIGNCDWPAAAKCNPKGEESSGEAEMNDISKPPNFTHPTNPTENPVAKPLDSYYKVICYFTNWAWYRKGIGRFTPDDIHTDLCTHIIYGFAVLDHSELILRTHDSWADVENKFYTRVSSLKSKGIKVSLALGGWNDSQGDKYSRLVRSPVARARFVRHALEFIEKYGFEGLDLDWEYPVCWQTECNKGSTEEKEGFTAWVQELSVAFRPRGLLLSTAVSPSRKIIDAGYDIPQLSRYFDWIAVMTYDFHGHWDKKTGHVAPLYHHPDDDFEHFNVNSSINYWIEKGAPSRKLVMGIPLYGQSFTLENNNSCGINAKAPGPGVAGEFTRAAGFLAYYEICERVNRLGWQVVHDEFGRIGPYAYKGTQWVSYDSPDMVRKKALLARSLNLGGGMVWALDLDDFRNRCGNGVHPLLSEIHKVLKDPPSLWEIPLPIESTSIEYPGIEGEDLESEGENLEVQSIEAVMQTSNEKEHELLEPLPEDIVDPNNQIEVENIEATDLPTKFKIVCYFTNWAWYRQSGGKFLPEDIDADLCTHIIYGFAVLSQEKLTIQPHDSWADLDNKFYERIVAYRKKGAKVTVAIGGWNDSAGNKYSRLVKNPEARSRFIRNVLNFIEEYNFDGLDLDWEYPVCWQVDCTKGTADEKNGFTALVRELFYAFQPKGLILSAAVSPNKKVIDAGYDVEELSHYFSWISVMAYDYHGQWDKKTGHVAPMYAHPDGTVNFNANFSMNYWISKGAERRKLVMGMPLYGQSFSLAETTNHQLNAPTYGGGEAGEATRARGFLAFYEICLKIRHHRWNVVKDNKGRMGPFAYHGDQWVSFDDVPMIRHKSEYIKAMGLGGAMIWALDLDDFKNVCGCESYPLLKAINRVLRGFGGLQPKCWLEQRKSTKKPNINPPFRPTINAPPRPSLDSVKQNSALNLMSIKCNNKYYLPHEHDCTKYYICEHGTHVERSCPLGLQWNKNYCDWPTNVQCSLQTDQRILEPSINRPSPTRAITEHSITNNAYKVVCYFTNWAWYRPSHGKYVPEDIDANFCTHIIYGFAVLDSNSLTIKTDDSWTDIDNRFYERVVKYKQRGLRVMLAIGGWNDSMGSKYARLVLDPQSRRRFVVSVLSFLEQYGFEGLDLAWEFPVCWQVDCDKGNPAEKEGFVALVKELSQAFKEKGLILSAAVSPSKMVIDTGYNVSELSPHFDWVAVMTYDFHGHWVMRTGQASPLFHKMGDDAKLYLNGNFSIHYWLERGIPREKLIMGMPMYGQTFTLADQNRRSLNDKTVGPGKAGTFTRANGFLAFYEICEKVGNGDWEVVRDKEGIFGSYAYSGNQWISYDDVTTIRRKAQFIKNMQLGGGMIWALDLDDFRGLCGCGKHPLLRTLNQELLGISGQKAEDCT
ncbi:probable chitinase 10 isoform X2 [Drosophila santomea]|uniref:probable chitinase 10 isoform X2 n=1 Tax=Drosophila santomea TaxID=129105 RepID=UPI00195328AF|nr:probable chitinase 10 isoform X2 [Drosophila santomea]